MASRLGWGGEYLPGDPMEGTRMTRGRAVPIEESDVLIAFALRFDGYKYHEERQFSPPVSDAPALSAAIEGMSVPERMATFFLLQRYLFKWGGEYLPMHGTAWQTFRRLFLMTCHEEVPRGIGRGASMTLGPRRGPGRS